MAEMMPQRRASRRCNTLLYLRLGGDDGAGEWCPSNLVYIDESHKHVFTLYNMAQSIIQGTFVSESMHRPVGTIQKDSRFLFFQAGFSFADGDMNRYSCTLRF